MAGSVGDFVDEARLALVVLAARVTACVRAVPAVLRAFCHQHASHRLTVTMQVHKYEHNSHITTTVIK